jgi:hypothetical protein
MDQTTLDELRRLEAAATEAPWGVEALPDGWEITGQPDGCYRVAKVRDANNSDQNFINPRFIAAMRNALPGLLDELTALRAASDELLLLKDELKQSDPQEYERRKGPAWEALRKARGK